MHVVAPEKTSTCSKGVKGKWIEKVYDCGLEGDISQVKVVEHFESRPHEAVSFLVERDKEVQVWNEQKMPKALPGYSGGKLPGRSTKEGGRDEEDPDEGREERKIRSEIAREVVASTKVEASAQKDAKSIAQRTVGQRVMQNWDCSHIENEEEEEEEDWQEGDQMAAPWDEEQKLEEILERRKMEGSSLQLEVMQKAPMLVVQERMSQGEGVKGLKEKKKVTGWSTEEMKEKPNISLE